MSIQRSGSFPDSADGVFGSVIEESAASDLAGDVGVKEGEQFLVEVVGGIGFYDLPSL